MREIYLLNDAKYEGVKNIVVFEIRYLKPKFTPKNYDALIFTSKNGVLGLDRVYKEWKNLPAYSIGEGTSGAIKKLGGNLAYEAKVSYADEFAVQTAQKLAGKLVLFARAKIISSDVGGILTSRGVHVEEIIVYESVCKPCEKFDIPKGAIFIFTSPFGVKRFFECAAWREDLTAIAIGKRTAAAFDDSIKPLIAPKQSIDACVEFAKRLSKVSL
ncbi:MAG: uroporphyrinogen-III synthase [Campylobacteraceae bacterium]|jgi:uroporphyrinogen-III synthase|nr:uroporphyrinogen-III synthase [Campylobacteraceae bacterium]